MEIDFDKIMEENGFIKTSPLTYQKPHEKNKDLLITYCMKGFSETPTDNYIDIKIILEPVDVGCENIIEHSQNFIVFKRIKYEPYKTPEAAKGQLIFNGD